MATQRVELDGPCPVRVRLPSSFLETHRQQVRSVANGITLVRVQSCVPTLACLAVLATASPAAAQRFPFERSLDVAESTTLDVSTIRGAIDVVAGNPGKVVVTGTVTVRIGFDVPANATQIARTIASSPPVERDRRTIRLRPPADASARRAVTVSYQVEVPPETDVRVVSDSGATTVTGIRRHLVVRTQSGAIRVSQIGDTAEVTSGSGAVSIDGVGGALTVTTSSSAISGGSLQGSVRARTQSGAVELRLTGSGHVDVETGSSAIRLRNVNGGLTASSRSGRVTIDGLPTEAWGITTGSGSVDISTSATSLTVELANRSGTLQLDGATIQGLVSKRRIAGAVGGGGPLVRVTSGSGSIRMSAGH